MISHCWYFIRLSTGGRLSAPVGPVRSRDGPPVNFVTKISPRPFKIPVPVPVNRKREDGRFLPEPRLLPASIAKTRPVLFTKTVPPPSLFDFRLIDGRACSLFPPSLPSWVVSRAGQSGALRDACIYGETPRIPGKIWLRLWLSSECCCWIAHPPFVYWRTGRTSRIYPGCKIRARETRNRPMLTRCRASVTRHRNSFVTSRSSSFRSVDGG